MSATNFKKTTSQSEGMAYIILLFMSSCTSICTSHCKVFKELVPGVDIRELTSHVGY